MKSLSIVSPLLPCLSPVHSLTSPFPPPLASPALPRPPPLTPLPPKLLTPHLKIFPIASAAFKNTNNLALINHNNLAFNNHKNLAGPVTASTHSITSITTSLTLSYLHLLFLKRIEVRGLWHFLLWHIMKCNNGPLSLCCCSAPGLLLCRLQNRFRSG